jgi:dienelactone hydrolase
MHNPTRNADIIDPGTTANFPFIGSFEYNEGTSSVSALHEFPDPHDLELKGVVYFPAETPGATKATETSMIFTRYPLVVIIHGNSSSLHSYRGYNYLLEHLARNGMIANSIHMYPNAKGVSRARALFKHIEIIRSKFGEKIDIDNIGLMGHSRGGEAVVIASKLNVDERLGYKFKAVIALAPTDQYGPYSLAGDYKVPFLVIYGSLDGDVAGQNPKNTGFSLYDRADAVKSFLFVQGACHDKFNVEWHDHDLYFQTMTQDDLSKVISADAHQRIVKGYMNAFFLWHLYGRAELSNYFTGELIPHAVATADDGSIKIHVQYQAPESLLVDKFTNHNVMINDVGGTAINSSNIPMNLTEGDLVTMDEFSPHDTNGGIIKWNNTKDIYSSAIPLAYRKVSRYSYLSFRITQRYSSISNPVNADQDFYVKLTDSNGNSSSILVSRFSSIPYPFIRGVNRLTKSALKTVRIPLMVYQSEKTDPRKLDMTNIASINFEFGARPTGEIEITDLEFGF